MVQVSEHARRCGGWAGVLSDERQYKRRRRAGHNKTKTPGRLCRGPCRSSVGWKRQRNAGRNARQKWKAGHRKHDQKSKGAGQAALPLQQEPLRMETAAATAIGLPR